VSGFPPPPRIDRREAPAVLLALAVLVATFRVASCCGLPFGLATLGLGTAWLAGVALFAAPHLVFLLAAAAVYLAGGAVLPWRQRSAVACAQVRSARARGVTLIGLLIGFVPLYLAYAYV
jgi:mercuric ion transport protein